jgi:hypothetical protein
MTRLLLHETLDNGNIDIAQFLRVIEASSTMAQMQIPLTNWALLIVPYNALQRDVVELLVDGGADVNAWRRGQ